MTPEERKAIAMRPGKKWSISDPACEERYPNCCGLHEGFDAALSLLVRRGVWIDATYAIEAAS